ncbi:MAG: 23S rRNA (uracil(1939)-C(5))-methyltransferase RlmD [Chlamydiales bacterium]|nr:23S rRNA (uracil(1939)-C(5))-methyltransferase RlmD [Chlamydiales bacterium]
MSKIKEFKSVVSNVLRLDSDAQGVIDWDYEGRSYKVKVPFALPGEGVELDISKKRRKQPIATKVTIQSSSTDRSTPKCPHYTQCGGCHLQHMSYEKQLEFKQQKINSLFSSYLADNSVEVLPIMACEYPWEYRNKMSFSFGQDKHSIQYLGMHQRGKRRVINTHECQLCPKWMTEVLPKVCEWWSETGLQSYDYRHNTGTLRELTLKQGIQTNDRFVMLSISAKPEYAPTKKQLNEFSELIKRACSDMPEENDLSIFLRLHQVLKGQETQVYEMQLFGPTTIKERLFIDEAEQEALSFVLSPQAFFQPNTLQAQRLYRAAFDLLPEDNLGVVYDLYCGIGSIGAVAAKRGAKKVYSVELRKESLMDGENNAKINDIDNQEFIWGDVQKVLQQKADKSRFMEDPDVVVLDPPRAGLGAKAVDLVLSCNPKYIIYISCNPKTQAKDLSLLEKDFCLTVMQAVDQFPQTTHVENIVILTNKNQV